MAQQMGTADAEMYNPALSNVLSLKRYVCAFGRSDVPYVYSHARRQLPYVIQVFCGVSYYVTDVCRAPMAPFVVSSHFNILACLAYCREFYQPKFYLRSSFNFIFLNKLSPLFQQCGTADAKGDIPSTENPALPALSLLTPDAPSRFYILYVYSHAT